MKLAAALGLLCLAGCAASQDPDFSRKLELMLRIASQGANGAYNAPQTYPAYQPPVRDYEWDWDQFYHENQLRWACRGVQTGQFAPESSCAWKPQTDFRWPAK